MTEVPDITRLLREAGDGNANALEKVTALVYRDLQRVAARHMRDHFGPGLPGVTLQPTALVNETFLKLIRQRKRYDNRGQFFAIATRVMLRVLMDYHRTRNRRKRWGGQVRVTLSGAGDFAATHDDFDIPAVVEAMKKLRTLDSRKADVVQLRVIWGLTVPEIAESLDVSVATVERDWTFSRRWLATQLGGVQE